MFAGSRRCSRNAIEDGFCRQHHPKAVEARAEASQQRFDDRFRRQEEQHRSLAAQGERIVLLEDCLRKMIMVNDALLPGIGRIAERDYEMINTVPAQARVLVGLTKCDGSHAKLIPCTDPECWHHD